MRKRGEARNQAAQTVFFFNQDGTVFHSHWTKGIGALCCAAAYGSHPWEPKVHFVAFANSDEKATLDEAFFPMKSTVPLVDEFIASLIEAFPVVEDIWYFDSRTAKECRLAGEANLVVFVSPGMEASKIEKQAAELIGKKFPSLPVGIHVFPQSAMFQTPRPLLVKMAFTSGRHIYCR